MSQVVTAAKGPAVPVPPYRGTRYDPPWAWLFAKGVYGPPDDRPHPHRKGYTREQGRMWFGERTA